MAPFLPNRLLVLFTIFLLHAGIIRAQRNLLLNGDFEDINLCSEYKADCGVEAWFYLTDVHVAMLPIEGREKTLGVSTLSIDYRWLPNNSFTPVIGTLLPCKLQAGHQYTFKGLFGAKFNALLKFKLGVAMGQKFYVPRRLFVANVVPDSIQDISESNEKEMFNFEYSFTAKGDEEYLTFGTFLSLDTSKAAYISQGSNIILLSLDNFELLADEPTEGPCASLDFRKRLIYGYDYRHKIMDNVLYTKGELPIPIDSTDSGAVTRTIIPPPPPKSDTIRLGDVLFDFNKANLKPTATQLLQKVFNQKGLQSIDSIFVEGHTDSVGSAEKNLLLSNNRSLSVKAWLLTHNILADDKIRIHAFGKSRPIATNNTPQGRSQNRRVELVIFRKED